MQGGVLGPAGSCFGEARRREARRFWLDRCLRQPQLAICDSGAIILIAGGGKKHNLPGLVRHLAARHPPALPASGAPFYPA